MQITYGRFTWYYESRSYVRCESRSSVRCECHSIDVLRLHASYCVLREVDYQLTYHVLRFSLSVELNFSNLKPTALKHKHKHRRCTYIHYRIFTCQGKCLGQHMRSS